MARLPLEGGRRRGKMDLRFPELQSIYYIHLHNFTTWMMFVIDIMDSNGKIC